MALGAEMPAGSAENGPQEGISGLLNRGLGWFKWLFDNPTAMAHDWDKPDGGADKPTALVTVVSATSHILEVSL